MPELTIPYRDVRWLACRTHDGHTTSAIYDVWGRLVLFSAWVDRAWDELQGVPWPALALLN